jgi:hypothetical protein
MFSTLLYFRWGMTQPGKLEKEPSTAFAPSTTQLMLNLVSDFSHKTIASNQAEMSQNDKISTAASKM